jgi:hypothetical protein
MPKSKTPKVNTPKKNAESRYAEKKQPSLAGMTFRGQCYNRNFRPFSPIFGETIGAFLKKQCYDSIFAKYQYFEETLTYCIRKFCEKIEHIISLQNVHSHRRYIGEQLINTTAQIKLYRTYLLEREFIKTLASF